ncbi:(2Fe-2S)-binding protein [Betaproteobacteria bacterium]|nr:(2Fe-2S)-binding protein [Betaproteobacteria bacterium]GHU06662.1 (2Fe-2S)-binding protein [Betaproteobacteria bacterium]GHU20914.1 (2Fe-2S)-binding protein [Betaproteobacteria bacterium]
MTTNLKAADLVQADRVHTSLYTSAEIFDEEMSKIFESTWVWVAHESEVPEAGSYKNTFVGKQPVIVVRDRKGEIRVLLNRCRHRCATVCEGKKGKTQSFVCPYHGWAFGLDGALRNVPYEGSYGSEGLDKKLFPLPGLRVESYQGMVFATFKEDIEPLVDYLGPAKKWMDLFMKQGAGYGIEVPGEQRFRFPGNWKIQLENTTDAYHFPLVHKSFLTTLDPQALDTFSFMEGDGFVEDLGNGHSVMVMIPELVDLEAHLDQPIPERFAELAAELAKQGLDDLKVRKIVRAVGGTGFNLNIFPNIACSMAFFRVLRPISVEETEIHHSVINMKDGPEIANQYRLRLHEYFQGPLGFGTPDDGEAWCRVQAGVHACGREEKDKWIMVNRGLPIEKQGADGPRSDVTGETGMRAAYQQWKKLMSA